MSEALYTLLREPQWREVLAEVFASPEIEALERFLAEALARGVSILPPQPHWFESLNQTPLHDVKVVILGQDPYPTKGHAHGLCFSVQPKVKPLPKSLINIYKELQDDCGIDNFHTGYLLPWASQGVLLLNAVLTVEEANSNAHKGRGWEQLTDAVIDAINTQCQGVVFLLWGAHAQKKGATIDREKHLVLTAPHPSPLSAYRGFWGSKPFSQINAYLDQQGKERILWQL
jgi:uracil-DNA glycosylase